MTEWPKIERITSGSSIGVKTFYKGKQYGLMAPIKPIFGGGKTPSLDRLEQELRSDILKISLQ